ncbi:biosynthetic peptidoglycan transglycosylase-like isoform X1 [Macadamia integrifolia]|uniref:biosynthetic peptidoglycan transglycosylase-like isoform X1 n=1 Tax=Macadamia integrifolia TaxID=60698 RepID=UPI001C4EC79B|nr:biosynthetic peptidoglycan transglycosylase-like isoform X1 [Macadamia integrifolia]
MALFAANSLRLHIIHYSLPKHPNRETIQIRSSNPTFSFFFSSNSSRGRNWAKGRVYSFYPWNSHQKPLRKRLNLEAVFLCVFFAILLYIRLLFTLLPLDFPQRWRWLMVFAEEADDRARSYPSHLWQAVVASEDRRFFRHCGIDPVGIARAVFYLSARGGGSTITQQLVKNAFLTTQRTFSRKIIEVVLAVILERMMSKWKILNTYLNNVYWGHGIFGIESASIFYFGKHPSLLSLGESAMLAGIIPSPERRSPLRHPSRGKASQARALRKMVEVGYLDIDTVLLTVNQPLHICVRQEWSKELLHSLSFPDGELGDPQQQCYRSSVVKEIWDWERESSIWEVREAMGRWAVRVHQREYSITTVGKSK